MLFPIYSDKIVAKYFITKEGGHLINIAVCDDEKYCRLKIKQLLIQYLDQRKLEYNIDIFSSAEEFCEQSLCQSKYNIVFLDINLKEMNGIDVAYKLRSYKSDVFIAFVTGYINYALDGYKVDAIRYILKETLDISISECMDAIFRKMEIQLSKMEFIFTTGKRQIYINNILYIESHKHKLNFRVFEMDLKEYEMYERLDNIELKVREYGFLRIHKSFLVNMKYIKRINHYMVILLSDDELPVPKLRYQEVKEAFLI